MKLLYKNDYGATFRLDDSPNPACELQLIIGTVGFFMSQTDLINFSKIVNKSDQPCTCEECGGNQCNKIWYTNSLIDVCLKVDEVILPKIKDLIKGTQFMLNIDATLEKHRLKPMK